MISQTGNGWEKAWHLLELATSPLAQWKSWNNKQAIRRRRERTQRPCKTLQMIKSDFGGLKGDDYLWSSFAHK